MKMEYELYSMPTATLNNIWLFWKCHCLLININLFKCLVHLHHSHHISLTCHIFMIASSYCRSHNMQQLQWTFVTSCTEYSVFPLALHHPPTCFRFYTHTTPFNDLGNSVQCIGYMWDNQGIVVSSQQMHSFFSLPPCPDQFWGPPSLLFISGKRLGHGANHAPLSSAEGT
jgi:hypothetical protein